MAQTVYENRVGILALVNLLRQFVNFGQSNTQNNANTHTPQQPQPPLALGNGGNPLGGNPFIDDLNGLD